jgi:hypothetical protein
MIEERNSRPSGESIETRLVQRWAMSVNLASLIDHSGRRKSSRRSRGTRKFDSDIIPPRFIYFSVYNQKKLITAVYLDVE